MLPLESVLQQQSSVAIKLKLQVYAANAGQVIKLMTLVQVVTCHVMLEIAIIAQIMYAHHVSLGLI